MRRNHGESGETAGPLSHARHDAGSARTVRSHPWTIVRADDKERARLNIICDIPLRLDDRGRTASCGPDPEIVTTFRSDAS
jgi:hypothetical protein